MRKRGLFLDRDGILNEIVMRDSIVGSPRTLEEFRILPAGIELVKTAFGLGYTVVVVTNQPDIGRGLMSREILDAMHGQLRNVCPISSIEVATSGDNADRRRKPNPGMILDAAHSAEIDLSVSFLVGDGLRDMQAGRSAGVRTVLLKTGYNVEAHEKADYAFSSLQEVTDFFAKQSFIPPKVQ